MARIAGTGESFATARRAIVVAAKRTARRRFGFAIRERETKTGIVIIDLQKFSAVERPTWQELEKLIDRLETEPAFRLNLEQAKRFHYLYERTSADLARLVTFAAEPELRSYLETLVARAYSEIHETRGDQKRFAPIAWFLNTLPQTFRRHVKAFYLSTAVLIIGALFG